MVGEAFGLLIAFLVIGSFVLCMVIFAFSWAGNYLLNYNEEQDRKRLKLDRERKKREAEDAERIKNAHKVRTQYPYPVQKETSFEITNVKESILVTETVYTD